MKASKAVRYGLGGLAAIVVLGACALYFGGPAILEKVLAHANEVSQKSTGKSLTFATPPSISLMPLGVSFEGVRWGDDASDLSVYAKSGHAKVSLGSILSGTPEVQEVVLQSPVVVIRAVASQTALGPVAVDAARCGAQPKDAAGAAGEKPDAGEEAAQARPEQEKDAGVGPLPIQLDRLMFQDGTFTLAQASGDEMTLSKVNLSVRNIGQGETGELECDFVAAIQKASGEYIEANLAVQGSARLTLPEVALNVLKITLTPVTGLYDKARGPSSLSVAGTLNLDTMALDLQGLDMNLAGAKMGVKGSGDLAASSFTGSFALDASPSKTSVLADNFGIGHLGAKGDIRFASNALHVKNLAANVDKAKLTGEMTLWPDPLAIKATLHCQDVDVNAFMGGKKDAKPVARGKAEAKAVRGTEPQKTATPVTWPQVDIILTGDNIVYQGVAMGKLDGTVTGKDGVYSVSPFRLSVEGNSQVDAKARLDLKKDNWQSSGTVSSMSLATLQKLAGQGFDVFGAASLNWDVAASGKETDELLKSAVGKGQLVVTNVSAPGVTKAIKGTTELAKLAVPERVDRVSVPFTLGGGHARFTATVTGQGVSGKGQGDADYVGRRIDATADVTISGTTVPLKINGPFSDVSVGVDAEKLLKNMGRGLMEDVVEDTGKINPGKDIKKMIPGRGGNILKGIF